MNEENYEEEVKKPEENTGGEESPSEETPFEDSEVEKTPEEEAEEILNKKKENRILVDKKRFDDRNDKAKMYETFAPIIDKIKDNPELVEELLETKKKGSLEDRVEKMEKERKEQKRKEMQTAFIQSSSKWKGFKTDWPEIESQVEMFIERGVSPEDAMRRSYLALHPEEAEKESQRIAQENANAGGIHSSGGGHSPTVIDTRESPNLNEREQRVAKDLLGKSFDNGFMPFKSEEDYAKALKKHEAHLKATGFYDLP